MRCCSRQLVTIIVNICALFNKKTRPANTHIIDDEIAGTQYDVVASLTPIITSCAAPAVLLLAALPAGAIGLLLSQHAWDRELSTVRDQHLQLALNLSNTLTRYAADASAHLQLFVSHLEERRSVKKLIPLLDRLHFQYVALVRHDGQIEQRIAVENSDNHEPLPASFLATLSRVQSESQVPDDTSGDPVFSPVQHDEAGSPILYLSYLLGSDRYAIGMLSTAFFQMLQKTIRFGDLGHAAIVDHLGHILAHPDPKWTQEARNISELAPIRRLLTGETGVTQFYSPKLEMDMIAGFSPVLLTGWGVIVPQPMAELRAHVRPRQRVIWMVIAITLLCSTLLGIVVSYWLASPLQRIGTAATRFANGIQTARVTDLGPFHTGEAAHLAAQFNAMADDVTQSWEARHASEERFKDFAQIAADWFWETNLQQVFTYLSPTLESGGGWHFQARLGDRWSDHLYSLALNANHAMAHDITTQRLQAYIDRAESFEDVILTVNGPDAQPMDISVAGKPMYDSSGSLVGYRGVARDITSRLRTEAQLLQAQRDEELRQSQKMEAIGTLAGGIAHDFNNILGVILGFSELTLLEVAKGGSSWHNLQQVLTAGHRAKELVRQILTFSRKGDQERQPVQFHVVIQEAMKLLRASLPTTIRIHQELAEDVGTILANPTQMQQVLMNLCLNAAYAMHSGEGLLEICLEALEVDAPLAARHPELSPGPYVCLIVRDNGQGIPEDVLERIFEPFFTTKAAGEGTGMGLAVVHGIVTSHGGAITVASKPGQGTTFNVYLPQLNQPVNTKSASQASVPQGGERILFVDDEASLARLAKHMLTRLGHEVVVTTSSLEALSIFRASPHAFGLVITDQTMPHMTGDALARELRRIRADIPIILCTGYSHLVDANEATAQGINAYLNKPILARDLAKAIQRACQPHVTAPLD